MLTLLMFRVTVDDKPHCRTLHWKMLDPLGPQNVVPSSIFQCRVRQCGLSSTVTLNKSNVPTIPAPICRRHVIWYG